MEIHDILSPDRIVCDLDASSKKRALEKISDMLSNDSSLDIAPQEVCESLIAREKLGSTGIGCGVAIPHGRLKSANKTLAAFVRLHKGIDYDAIDNKEVDLIFALLVPENSTEDHLQILAELAEMFSNSEILEKLRNTNDSQSLCQVLSNWKQFCK
ncbi:MAG: PTS IIA-like nitrogen regulatory protein PtsN [Thiohalomonadales bacterium]